MTILYGRTSSNITLADALSHCASVLNEAVGLFYSPSTCRFIKLKDGIPVAISNKNQQEAIDLSSVFEARIFNETYEFRWLNEVDGNGQAVLLADAEITKYLEESVDIPDILSIEPNQYLLWGKGVGKSSQLDGWSILATARIGSLLVPVSGAIEGKRVYLKTQEYLKEVDEYGNVAVVEERLVKLEVK